MKKTSILLMTCMITLFTIISCNNNPKTKNMETTGNKTNTAIFPKGDKGPTEWFTGTVWVTTLMKPNENLHYTIGDVKFEAGARTYWHTHPIEQVLLVTEGKGFYQEKGQPARALSKGDVVVIPPLVEHWHGATPDSNFTHIAITNYKDNENVTWLNPVSEEEYNNLPK